MREQLKERLEREYKFHCDWKNDVEKLYTMHLEATGERLIDKYALKEYLQGKLNLIRELQRDFIDKRCTCHE